MMPEVMIADAADRLRLIRTPTIRPITYRQLMARFGTASAALSALPELAARGRRRLDVPSMASVEAEQPPGVQPQARHFPRRNRIIAGLEAGTLVIEAAPRSGSLITARLAADYGREVMAVPGSPLDPRAQGCNQLMREGATLVQSSADVLEALSAFDADGAGGTLGARFQLAEPAGVYEEVAAEAPDEARRVIESLLSPAPVAIDELVRQSGVSAAIVAHVLLDLELDGTAERHAGGRVARARASKLLDARPAASSPSRVRV